MILSEIFKFLFFLVIVTLIIKSFNNTDNILLVILIFMVSVFLFYQHRNHEKIQEEKKIEKEIQEQIKNQEIIPYSETVLEKKDVRNLLYYINEFYDYNPAAFQDLVICLEEFFRCYNLCISDITYKFAGEHYARMQLLKEKCTGSLHDIIYSFPANNDYQEKLNLNIQELENILSSYLEKIYELSQKEIHINGYTPSTRLLRKEKDPKEYNHLDYLDQTLI